MTILRELSRGDHIEGLLYYLYGPGRADTHTNPHLVAGFRHPVELEPPLLDSRRDFRHLTGLMRQPVDAQEPYAPDLPVWHTVVRNAPGDRILSDDDWGDIAARVMQACGLAPYGEEDQGVRWLAVRHAPDHVHIVATLARQDGRTFDLNNSWYRMQRARREIEKIYGLQQAGAADGTAVPRPTRVEVEKTKRHGWQEVPRVAIKRAVSEAAAATASENDFFTRLEEFTSADLGRIVVRKRCSAKRPGEVTGYAVGMENHRDAGGPIFYSGGSLASDLALPSLRRRWATAGSIQPGAGSPVRFNRQRLLLDDAAAVASAAAEAVAAEAAIGSSAISDVPWAAADLLHMTAQILSSAECRRVAHMFDRAVREPYRRMPRSTPLGNGIRTTARTLATVEASDERPASWANFLACVSKLVEAVGELRQQQHRPVQAAAARRAAARLAVMVNRMAPQGLPSDAEEKLPSSVRRELINLELSGSSLGRNTSPSRAARGARFGTRANARRRSR